ncbi:hypothetical protein N0V90_003527 [Kalmusia sp. IMI 367209]|nr:hypothetical protein N0V90_003527 [Kalmusia sp. IMI 367209]
MFLLKSPLQPAALLLALFNTASAAIPHDNLIIDDPNLFNTTLFISKDRALGFDISTTGPSPSYLVAIENTSFANPMDRSFSKRAQWHNAGPIAEYWLGDWEVEADIELDAGITAYVDMSISIEGISQPVQDVQRILMIPGPTSKRSFSGRATPVPPADGHGYCSGLDPGVRTFVVSATVLQFTVGLLRTANASETATGAVWVEQREGAVFSDEDLG